ncbi:MAG: type II methionyl aminopeptidase [Candidatus Hodarchaeota archaeon]
MDPKNLEDLKRSGRITATILSKAKSWLKPGVSILQICEKIENAIQKLSAMPAFPVNISINEQAAHYTSPPYDKSVLPSIGVVKLDIGASIDGWITDTAVSVALSKKFEEMVRISQEALNKAISLVKDGIRISLLSAAIQDVIESAGYVPVKNLTGHRINQYNLHTGMTIPNVKHVTLRKKLKTDMILAIEPFVTTGKSGWVVSAPITYIFSLNSPGKEKMTQTIWNTRKRLPFCTRWVTKFYPQKPHTELLRILEKNRNIIAYPILIDQDQGIISQSEHTVLVDKNGCSILTSPN